MATTATAVTPGSGGVAATAATVADLERLLGARNDDLRRRNEVIRFLQDELQLKETRIRELRAELDKLRQVVPGLQPRLQPAGLPGAAAAHQAPGHLGRALPGPPPRREGGQARRVSNRRPPPPPRGRPPLLPHCFIIASAYLSARLKCPPAARRPLPTPTAGRWLVRGRPG
ncbi:hypothetical protein ONE63_006167 [Megalurothrips usitatus]|uniref:Uncharacterized protein n=1 Tax=Megalurothrips usitatus TaxID=439358 RepID=A0AAV7XXG0_9NEOP|nr:hypothetical protein ONE63_006167 [Megalurothrips usitatus]